MRQDLLAERPPNWKERVEFPRVISPKEGCLIDHSGVGLISNSSSDALYLAPRLAARS